MANLLVTNSAFINNLTAHQVVIIDTDKNIVAGMTSSDDAADETNLDNVDNVIIWAGTPESGSTDINAAPFTVTETGAVKASNINIAGGTISGNLTATATNTTATFNGTSLEITDTEPASASHANNRILISNADGIKNISTSTGNFGDTVTTTNLRNGELMMITQMNARSSY